MQSNDQQKERETAMKKTERQKIIDQVKKGFENVEVRMVIIHKDGSITVRGTIKSDGK